MQRQNFAAAKAHLEQILAKDGSYKFGDVSLAYCRTLVTLNENDAALEQVCDPGATGNAIEADLE